MGLLFLSLILILSTVDSQFTAFYPHQVDSVHARQAPVFQPGQQRILPRFPSLQQNFPRRPSVEVYQQRPGFPQQPLISNLNQPGFPQQPLRSNLNQPGFGSGRGLVFSPEGNIVQQSKALADSAKVLFSYLQNITLVPELFDHVFETSGCLGNLKDAIELMDQSNALISRNGPEIIYLEAIVESLMNEKNVTKLIRASAKMLRILEDLVPKLTESSKTSNICISNPKDSVDDFKALAHLLRDVQNHRDIELPDQQRQIIEDSIVIMNDVAKFLKSLNKSLDTFRSLCDNDGNMTKEIAVYNSIGDIMENLGALFKVLGSEEKAKDIMKQGDFIKEIVESLRDVDELSSTLECGANGSYENLALTLDDLAEIVQSVGIEPLAKELGIDLDFIDEF